MTEFEGLRKKVFDDDDFGEETDEKKTEAFSTPQPGTSSGAPSEPQEGTHGAKTKSDDDKGTELPKDPNPHIRMASGVALEEIEEVLEKCLQKICHIKSIVGNKKENDEYTKELLDFYISLMLAKNTNLMDGEWLERKIVYMANTCRKTELDCLPNIVKEALRDVYPNIPIFPVIGQGIFHRKESAIETKVQKDVQECEIPEIDENLLVEKMKYKVKSKMMEHKGEMKRLFPCPYPGCGKFFRSNKTGDACLNKHLNIVYSCDKCEFMSHNLDSFRNHTCFAYSSARKRQESPGKQKGPSPKKVKKETMEKDVIILDEGTEEKGIKKEKKEVGEEEIIEIEDD